MLYYCKPPNVVLGVHDDDQIALDPIIVYGPGTYVVVDYHGGMPPNPLPPPPVAGQPQPPPVVAPLSLPTMTAKMQADSVKIECRRRILTKVSEQAQRNIMSHVNDIQMNRMTSAPARLPTPEEQSDMDNAAKIWDWIGRPNGMQAAGDALITAYDLEWYQDVKWPPWTSSWDAFVARF